ncbi:Cof-type HAD-IIB family hydrolase [Virgibacillus siamensis]|uniref:Cof-type HAD-IIB family hydrolase n=1 Tax=Virgibacillus siamensis TaxID=480071 RepID=UPI00098723CD|nr:Cof-type HAD-IIB family hydrolase [Virgibacillus siamensis]
MDKIKLVALDMDGTLLTNDEEISDYTQQVIRKTLAKDVHVVLSTGRGIATCLPYAKQLSLPSFLITANGGEIWTVEEQLLEQHLLDPKMVQLMFELGKQMEVNSWMISTDKVWRGGEGPENFYDYEWLKYGCDSLDTTKLDNIVKELSHYDELELTNSLPTNIEVNPKGVNKASALRKLCDKLDITMNNVLAIGDSLNDIKMIQQAGLGIAMGNAQEAIKKVADHVTDTNNQDGVAKAIETFVLNQEKSV